MFYPNLLNLKNITYKKHKYASFSNGINVDIDENLLPVKYSPMTYNFDYSNGALKDGMGISSLKFKYNNIDIYDMYKTLDSTPDSSFIHGCWLFNSWAPIEKVYVPLIVVYTSSGDFYYNVLRSDRTEIVKIEGLKFQELPIVSSYKLDGQDTLILVSEKDGMYIWQYPYYVKKIENAPSISSMCVHNERLFVSTRGEKRKIWFSDDLNPTNFNVSNREGGFIELADEFGKSNKVLSFEGYLYVFRDFNIARITAYADQNDFSVSQLYVSNGRIYEKSVCLCGNKIMYLASDGIYVFSGSSATRLNLSINKFFEGVDNSYATAGYCDGYYYLSCKLNYNDETLVENENKVRFMFNNALIRINVSTGEMVMMRGYDIKEIFVINDILENRICVQVADKSGGFMVGILDKSGCYYGVPIKKVWKSPKSDFGYPEKEKLIREITLETKQDITIQICADDVVKSYELTGGSGYRTIRPYIKGSKIAINFISNKSDNMISNPHVVVGYL